MSDTVDARSDEQWDAGPVDKLPRPIVAIAPQPTDGPGDEGGEIVRQMLQPTIRRMLVLTTTLVRMTGSGDFALWAPLATMEQAMLDLTWQDTRPLRRWLLLASKALMLHAERLGGYGRALASLPPDATVPPLPTWSETDTIRMYDEVVLELGEAS